jgi:phage repressor protein C with HTH and peptisase S24 domain
MANGMVIPERLKDRLDAASQTQAGLARAIGVSQTTIAKLAAGSRGGSKHLHLIARELGTTPAYLTGETDDPTAGALPRPSPALIAEQLDVVQLPMLNLKYGMGGGTVVDDEQAELIPMSRKWLRTFTNSDPSQLFLTRGTGDSMSPTILHEDMLIGDRSQTEVLMGDQIWAITHYGAGLIKRLRPMEGGYRILSDNSAVPPDTATDGSMQIVGRIIYVMRGI